MIILFYFVIILIKGVDIIVVHILFPGKVIGLICRFYEGEPNDTPACDDPTYGVGDGAYCDRDGVCACKPGYSSALRGKKCILCKFMVRLASIGRNNSIYM